MKILLSNDDGVYAPGIRTLYNTLKKIADVTVVAPLEERSATGHTLTLDFPLRVVEVEKNVYGCSGFPADCALMGLAHLMKDSKPDLVVSGINRGANLGQDIFYSGTVAAAREASFRGIPAIAISSVVDFLKTPPKGQDDEVYQTAADFVKDLILHKAHEVLDPLNIYNINVPNQYQENINSVELTKPGFRNYSEEILERSDFKGRKYYWIGGVYKGFDEISGSDCLSVENNNISLSVLDLTSRLAIDDMKLDKIQELTKKFSNWPEWKKGEEL